MQILFALLLLWIGAAIGVVVAALSFSAKFSSRPNASSDDEPWSVRVDRAVDRFRKEDSGATAAEYVILVGSITLALIVAVPPLAEWVSHNYGLLLDLLSTST